MAAKPNAIAKAKGYDMNLVDKPFGSGKSLKNHEHPFLSRTGAFVTHEEVYGKPITYDEIVALVQSLPTEYWLRVASMGRIFLEHYEAEHVYQGILFRYLCPEDLLQVEMPELGNRERFLFHRPQFLCLMRLALLHAHLHLPSSSSEEKRKDITARCLLGISSHMYRHYYEVGSPLGVQGLMNKLSFDSRRELTEGEKRFLASLFQVYHNYTKPNLGNAVGRYKDMLLDIPGDPAFSPEGVSRNLMSTAIDRELGLTLSQYAALTFGIIAKYISPEGIFKEEFHFPIDRQVHFSQSPIPQTTVDRFFRFISQSQSEFVEEQKKRDSYPGVMNDFRSFAAHPLIHLDDSHQYYPVSLAYLQNLLDSGVPWVIGGGRFREDLRNYWGQAFEFYCRKLCDRIATQSRGGKARYFADLPYGPPGRQKRSCDAILVYGDHVVLIEFKIKSPKLFPTVVEGDFESLVNDIKTAFIGGSEGEKAAAQIDATFRAIRGGELTLPGIDVSSIRAYFPLIVTLHDWPLNPFIYELIRMLVKKDGFLRNDHIAEVEIWSANELELVEAVLTSDTASHQMTVASLLREKLLGHHVNLPMSAFLGGRFPGRLPKNTYVRSKMKEMLSIVKDTLSLNNSA